MSYEEVWQRTKDLSRLQLEGGYESYVSHGRPPLQSSVCLQKKQTSSSSSSSSSYGRWSELPGDIVAMILMILDSIDDHLNFTKVCKSWRYVASRIPFHLQIPLVLLPFDTRRKARWISLLDISTGKIHEFNLPKPIHGGTCYGCSKGWLLMGKRSWESIKPTLFLFNPISGSYIKLPSIPITIPIFRSSSSFLLERFQLSSADMSLSLADSTVAIICHGVIAICRPNSPKTKRWITFGKGGGDYADIFFSGDSRLFALSKSKTLQVEELHVLTQDGLILTIIPNIIPELSIQYSYDKEISHKERKSKQLCFNTTSCFVQSTNDGQSLVLVTARNRPKFCLHHVWHEEGAFQVFKLSRERTYSCGWSATLLESWDDQVLFLAESGSLSLRAREENNEHLGSCEIRMDNGSSILVDPHISYNLDMFYLDNASIRVPNYDNKKKREVVPYPYKFHTAWFTPSPC